jgi:hypothetical protein
MRRWGAERRREFKIMENHLYTCIYDIQKQDIPPDKKIAALNRYRAKLVRLQARRTEHLLLDTSERDRIDGEETTLYQVLKAKKIREARIIQRTQNQQGRITEEPTEIAYIFVEHWKEKYSPIDVSDKCVEEMLNAVRSNDLSSYVENLEKPITAEELRDALKSGGPNKTQGPHGISREFYVRMWDVISDDILRVMNQMYIHKDITRRQQHGIIVSIPKDTGDITPNGYRPITLMNTDYKLLARIMARRLTPIMAEQISSSQYCSIPGKSILEAVSAMRDVIAHAELKRTPLCILSLDFKSAFDRISHHYLFRIFNG